MQAGPEPAAGAIEHARSIVRAPAIPPGARARADLDAPAPALGADRAGAADGRGREQEDERADAAGAHGRRYASPEAAASAPGLGVPMSFADWLRVFRSIHAEARRGALSGDALREYREARDELARALLAAQRVALEPGVPPRRTLRAARALQADLAFFDGTLRIATRSISSGGFAAVLAKPQKVGEEVKVTLRLPGEEPLQCAARVVEAKAQAGSALVSFRFVGLAEEDAERLETLVFDGVLEQLQG